MTYRRGVPIQEVPVILPCGCKVAKRIVDGERQLVMEPCSPDCEYFQYALDRTQNQTKPVRKQRGTFGPDGRVTRA